MAIDLPGPHYDWPAPHPSLDIAVRDQLHRSLSDRDASGVIGDFEGAFRDFVGVRHALSFSSGTGALHALAATCLAPGDKIIAPAYTFFATASPFAHCGLEVLFADCEEDGNVSVRTLGEALQPGVRAVVITHMWGIVCDMPAIAAWCMERDLLLFEDCSHAHFGSLDGTRVGTFGDAAVFSCNQKAITSGEGGVLTTNSDEIFNHALLFGHYNKRCKQELPPGDALQDYAFTGYGLKYRMHTLSAAIGVHQLERAVDIEARRRANLDAFKAELRDNAVVQVIDQDDRQHRHGLYVIGFRFKAANAQCTKEEFVHEFVRLNGRELDIPGATRDISSEPLFVRGLSHGRAQGRRAVVEPPTTRVSERFPGALSFASAFMKLPLWGYSGDEDAVTQYAQLLRRQAERATR